jgi:hypothetical protein
MGGNYIIFIMLHVPSIVKSPNDEKISIIKYDCDLYSEMSGGKYIKRFSLNSDLTIQTDDCLFMIDKEILCKSNDLGTHLEKMSITQLDMTSIETWVVDEIMKKLYADQIGIYYKLNINVRTETETNRTDSFDNIEKLLDIAHTYNMKAILDNIEQMLISKYFKCTIRMFSIAKDYDLSKLMKKLKEQICHKGLESLDGISSLDTKDLVRMVEWTNSCIQDKLILINKLHTGELSEA